MEADPLVIVVSFRTEVLLYGKFLKINYSEKEQYTFGLGHNIYSCAKNVMKFVHENIVPFIQAGEEAMLEHDGELLPPTA